MVGRRNVRFVRLVIIALVFICGIKILYNLNDVTLLNRQQQQQQQYEPDPVLSDEQHIEWSKIKLVIYMTTHLSESHLLYFSCWYDAIQRMEIFQYADLILYTSIYPNITQLAMLPFRNVIIKLYENTGKQSGAIQAMIDPFIENYNNNINNNSTSWFDNYDWVIRLNPDVLIRKDTWLIYTMLNTSINGIFHDCFNRKVYNPTSTDVHTDFYAFRPKAIDIHLLLRSHDIAAEPHMSNGLRNIFNSTKFVFLKDGYNSKPGICRIEGRYSSVIHSHNLWKHCPNYYNAHEKGVY